MNVEKLMLEAAARRSNLFGLAGTNCFRIVNGEGDGISGVFLDRYGDWLLVQAYGEAVDKGSLRSEYQKAVIKTAAFLPVDIKGILFKSKERSDICPDQRSLLIEGSYPPEEFVVEQNGIKALANLIQGVNTGIFPDMRQVREELENFYRQYEITSLLNLFCYTGLFSVHGLKNGIKHAVNVDLSASALKRAKANYGLNGLNTDDRDFIRDDAASRVRSLIKKRSSYSMIIVDPPTFARNKKAVFSVKDDYGKLLANLSCLAQDGYVLSALNTVSLTKEDYFKLHPKEWKNLIFRSESDDFPFAKRPYLKTGLWKVS